MLRNKYKVVLEEVYRAVPNDWSLKDAEEYFAAYESEINDYVDNAIESAIWDFVNESINEGYERL